MTSVTLAIMLLLSAGAGYAIVIAAREFVKGVSEIHLANKIGATHSSDSPGGSSGASEKKDSTSGHQRRKQNEGQHRGIHEGIHQVPWYIVLEVSPEASVDEIKRAYRHMISLYHPDRVADLGPDLHATAERRSKEINSAYATARRVRGI